MQRRSFFKSLISAIFAAFGISLGGLTFIGCDKGTVITWSNTVVSFLEQALPIFQEFLPASAILITQAISIAKELQVALKINSTNAIDLIQQLIAPGGLFQKILESVGLIKDEAKRRLVSGILAVVGITLNVIATALHQGTPPAVIEKARSQKKAGVDAVESIAKSNVLERALGSLRN